MDIRSLSGPMELSDILDTPSPLIRVNACMYEYMPHMYIFVTALSNIPLIMLCMFPHGLYSLLDYEINLSLSHINCIVARCLISVGHLSHGMCLNQVMMTLHFWDDVADAESTQESKITA